ncbi:flagellar basal-body rod protein FlgG [Paenibacillus cellulosilyticus]|uniref:Flagellar basal-body rod protein FlgG n=1 Tax=Paenibacillus cellulosilyticus TaxID=375489 RepID=A0A2V2YZS5_9BACL|nr:flagellar hook-basal body protein [Paenibacillus cellulosilyticus]PWW08385.1 flagellar basal-body rod protein FlgG [Paenibacillus cellulosilyticus]QKS47978.1 flagellar hook-basal body protein [Paenibacillus cellulosilyticus]
MLRGLYTAAAGLTTQQRRHDTVTNNIANLNTPGYKQSNEVTRTFPDMLLALTGTSDNTDHRIGRVSTGVFAEESLSLQLQGDLTESGRSGDFGLSSNIQVPGVQFDASGKSVSANGETTFQPQAFFTLEGTDGQPRYTRDGRFDLDAQGYLVTSEGTRVLGTNGQPIQFQQGVSMDDLVLTSDYRFVDGLTGADTGNALQLTRINNPNMLVREGNGKFRLEGDTEAVAVTAADGVEVRQGYYERSNVDAAQSSVDLMAALRAYEANQKVVQFYDKSLDKAVNEVGKV